jgi:hypothetical protein
VTAKIKRNGEYCMSQKIEVNQEEVQYIQTLFDNLQTHLGIVSLILIIKTLYPQYADQRQFITNTIESWKKHTKKARGEIVRTQAQEDDDEDVARILSEVHCQGDVYFQSAVDKVGDLMETILINRVLK